MDAVNEHGSYRAAARHLGCNYTSVQQSMTNLERVAALRGVAPAHDMTHAVPHPFLVSGVSTLYNEEGGVSQQWVKTKLDHSQVDLVIRDFVADLIKDAKGLSRPIPAPAKVLEDILSFYPIGDPHFGMYSWKAETGADFDTGIAEQLTIAAMDRLVASAPNSETAIIAPLGDIMHADDTKNRTPQSGNQLDVDTRHQRVMRIALGALKHCIYRALEKHQRVIVRLLQGNHDPHASFALALALSEGFSNNDRVYVDLSPAYFWYHRFGSVLIGLTHGDKARGNDLLGVMASDRPEDWGKTKFRYFFHGHLHSRGVKEMPGLLVEWFRTLAPADAWAAGEGYRAGRDMCCVVFDKDAGEIERHTCNVATLSRP